MNKNKFKMDLQFFAMNNPDLLAKQKAEIMVKMHEAMQSGNEEQFTQAFTEYTDMLQEAVMAEAKGMVQASDNQILMGRGARPLTSEENKYYQKLITALQDNNPQQALTLIDETLPKTVIDAVFEDITETHPLLQAINFQNTGILTEIIVSTIDGRFLAHWGDLCDEITKELSAGFDTVDLRQAKLSAFIPICKAMLDIGPTWIDRYVRTILGEAIANGLEKAIIDGNGVKQPVGMRRDPNGVFHPVDGYPLTVPMVLNEITPETYGGIIAELAVSPNGLNRTVSEVLLVVNPVDYFTKLMPSTTVMVDGKWLNNIFPFPTKVVQSVWVPQNEVVIGIGRRYFFGLGIGKGGKIEYSDHVKFLEDKRVYLTKLYGNGKALDSKSFLRLDISGLHPAYPIVRVTDYVDARLASASFVDELTNSVALSPQFGSNVRYYTASVADSAAAGDNNVAELTVDTVDPSATVTVTLNGAAVTAEATGEYKLTLLAGQNVVVVSSAIGAETEAYVFVIEYTAIS